ncbi:peptidoglycan DD-metalloendopeptidase family protein [Leifsonia sp. YIM 134122]|uniref:Peptidoglycan DD-metalloendopeptidase family protein n=1 Tax=Leifsonia stereocauli TaxID=3134136 RepID=A0ABU9W7N4_9MICO
MEHRVRKYGLRRHRPETSPRSPRPRGGARLAAVVVAIALGLTGGLASPASADEYPTWDDLQKAKSNTAAAADKVAQITDLIEQIKVQVAQTQAEAEKRGEELQVAQDAYDQAVRKAEDIQAQADASQKTADDATAQAGQLAAQLYRTGGTDLTANLMLDQDGAKSDALLSQLGSMSKLVERSSEIYETAHIAANTAASLGEQAKIAQGEREKLRIAAESALAAAVEAQQAAEAALAESVAKSAELAAQLAFLKDTQAKVATEYQKGVEERARLERERLAREAAARAQAAAEAAAAAAASGGGGGYSGGGGSVAGGSVGSSGWAIPASGRITDGYGARPVLCGSGGCSGSFHYGADIGAGCGSPIYAAASGTVVYTGYLGTYGNYVKIDHGNGVATGYAHIGYGGTYVGVGQQVSAGQNIASVGTTGASTGCHLHYEVYNWGTRVNPFPWMADRGVPLG